MKKTFLYLLINLSIFSVFLNKTLPQTMTRPHKGMTASELMKIYYHVKYDKDAKDYEGEGLTILRSKKVKKRNWYYVKRNLQKDTAFNIYEELFDTKGKRFESLFRY